MSVAAVVAAAGRGERLGAGEPKALRMLGGVPLLVHAVRALTRAELVDLVVVAAPADQVDGVRELLANHGLARGTIVVAGGSDRQQSVSRALDVLPADVEVVLVHDAARPLAPSTLVDSVARAVLAGHGAVVPGVAVTDTVKRVGERDGSGEPVVATVDRGDLRCVQTPQGFDRALLVKAHAAAPHMSATDDAGLIEQLGLPVTVIAGHDEAFKITRPLDLVFAEAVLAQRPVLDGGPDDR